MSSIEEKATVSFGTSLVRFGPRMVTKALFKVVVVSLGKRRVGEDREKNQVFKVF